jgi:hypothetical protein
MKVLLQKNAAKYLGRLDDFARPLYTVETDLTEEEGAIIEAGDKEFREDPESFVPLESIE